MAANGTDTTAANEIAAIPGAARRICETLERNLAVVRRRLGRPLTLAEKLVLGHLDDAQGQSLEPGRSYLRLRPDRVAFQDVLGQTGILQFMQTGLDRVAVPTTIHCDHLIQARQGAAQDLRESLAENGEVYDFLRAAAARYGAGFWEPGAGIIHQVILENYAFPGVLIIGTDSHTPNAGGLGACAVGVGGADAVEVIAGLPWELLYPLRIGVHLSGCLQGWTAPKDVILHLAGVLTASGATNAIIEYFGPGTASISATGKATITNMGAELGATTSVFPFDGRMAAYLRATRRGDLIPVLETHRQLLEPDAEVVLEPERCYDRVIRIDLSALEPHIVGPHTPDRSRPLSQLAAELAVPGNAVPDGIATALIGSCTNSSYEDMSRAADVAGQARSHGLKAAVPYWVTPGSEQVRATIARDGQMEALAGIGAAVLANACGPCIGQWRRAEREAAAPNVIVTSYNRNFPARNDGRPSTMNFIASPEIVTALALAGRLSFNPHSDTLQGADGLPFKLVPPAPAPEVPPGGFAASQALYVAPPADGRGVSLNLDPASERIQAMQPWPAWDGRDFLDLPILMKAKGKTTTDDIAPAGQWLRFRGNLEKFSDSLLAGATSAWTGKKGTGHNVFTGSEGRVAENARDYRARGVRWIIVGDWNYGEGSSREHAALAPRLLGAAAVVARSFARIHESNLKKQGVLALTFANADDYERVREDDRVTLAGLSGLAAGRPVQCRVRHTDGTVEDLALVHSYSDEQLEWFRKGSALNGLREAAQFHGDWRAV
jgi:aconitate hydratase